MSCAADYIDHHPPPLPGLSPAPVGGSDQAAQGDLVVTGLVPSAHQPQA